MERHNRNSRRSTKTKPCHQFIATGRCRYGDACKFSHTIADTNTQQKRSPTKNTLDGPSRQKEDKLRSWKLITTSSNSTLRPNYTAVSQFINLGLQLMDSDIGISQETIKELAKESGLGFIKAVTDLHILEATQDSTKAGLWLEQVEPLLRLVSHPCLVDSNILEQEAAIVYSFLVGVNAARMKKLFDFILNLADKWNHLPLLNLNQPLMSALELSLSVLSKAIDCSTTNIVNDDFHNVVSRFTELVNAAAPNTEDFSKLQASKYIDYLQRRLGVGKTLAEVEAGRGINTSAKQETFLLRRDLPGNLSPDGPRHDNDHADISRILILPTYQEIMTSRSEYLPTTDSSQWHIPGIRGRLDREFRLLREDTVGQLRDAVRDMLNRIQNPGHREYRQSQNSARTSAYENPEVYRVTMSKNIGLELTVKCRQPDVARKMNDNDRRSWWDQCKRLQTGALTCLINDRGMLQFFVVAESTVRVSQAQNKTEKNETDENDEKEKKRLTLSTCPNFLYVKLNLVDASRSSVARALGWYQKTTSSSSSPRRSLVEFPGVLLASFKHTLEALQQLSQHLDLPFLDLIAPETPSLATNPVISAPLFARAPGFEFDLTCLAKDKKSFKASIRSLPTAEKMASRTGLDLTQSEAFLNTLNRELSLIQGPPGTGKSYTGEKLIQALLANKSKAKLGPIICVCYTNHALDQLLEHLLDSGIKNIIRMGSRSKSDRLSELNLRTIADDMVRTRSEKKDMYDFGQEMQKLEQHITAQLIKLSGCDSSVVVRDHLRSNHIHHFHELFTTEVDDGGFTVVQHQRRNVIQHWLYGGLNLDMANTRELSELRMAKLTEMTRAERLRLYRDWLKKIRDPIIDNIIMYVADYEMLKKRRDRIRQELRRRCLQEADVVGVTTTGLARDHNLLRKLGSKVVVCEEAGEVLEAHILTTLLPSVQQLILIGDHLQLRPQIQNYELQSTNPRGVKYSFDTSFFERLVQPHHLGDPRLPVSVLETQRRMYPSIAEMVRSTLYKSLKDAEHVKEYPEVVGLARRLFWLDHHELEVGADNEDPQNTSRSNDFEVEMVAAIVSHVIRQGTYGPDDIAVLTPYLGQLQKLCTRMAAEATFAVNVEERDLVDLLHAEIFAGQPPTDEQSVSKTTLLRSVRLATVDNFQGEEAKLVIISLVRSNHQNRCGFLSTSNRINVLLSRAQHGCYIIGNSNTYQGVPMWNDIINLLQRNGNIGTQLELKCPRHPDKTVLVSQPDHFATLSPDGGCTIPCDSRLSCGHACYGPCHSDMLHKAVKCHEKCPRPKEGCDHACPRECGDPCEARCNVMLNNINLELSCGHILPSARCWEAQAPDSIKCNKAVDREVPGCGHTVRVPCHVDITVPTFLCRSQCGTNLSCGHTCRHPCHRCKTRKDGQVVGTDHGTCRQVCRRHFTTCPHTCRQTCHGGEPCAPCTQPCEVRCSHSRCGKPCHEPCAPCAEEKCASHCPHTRCTMPCAAPCDWVPCSKRCLQTLACGHQCPSLCGETCPDIKYCQQCGSQDILSTVVDYLEMSEYKEIDLDTDPCVFPDCGHFLTRTSMDGQMSIADHYELDSDTGLPVGIKDMSKPFSVDEVKVCPQCRGSLRNISRYGRIVRRAMLDEATKKFISWSHTQHLELAQRLLVEQERLEKSMATSDKQFTSSSTVGRLVLKGDGSRQIANIQKYMGAERYRNFARLYLDIAVYHGQVKIQEQPFQKVVNCVRHANRQKASSGSPFTFGESVIQLRGYLFGTSLLLQCQIAILSDFVNLWKDNVLIHGEIEVDFTDSLGRCQELIDLSVETDRPQLEAEGHVYYAKFCGFAVTLGVQQPSNWKNEDGTLGLQFPQNTATTAAAASSKQEAEKQGHALEQIKSQGLEHLDRAKNLLTNRSWPSKEVLEAELEAAKSMLNGGVFYRPVTTEELRAVYTAMSREFSGTGHWYTCERGHPFTVGECGMPMQMARCPECGSPVGGESHLPAAGVRHATEIEALSGGIAGMGI